MTPKRVVITGVGVVSAVGSGRERFFETLVQGRSGIGPITRFDASMLRSRIAGEVRDLDLGTLDTKLLKRSSRFTHLALAASAEALAHAGLDGSAREEAAVVIGTGIGGFDDLEREHAAFLSEGPEKFRPLTVAMIIPNMGAGMVAIAHGLRGPCLCPTTACATGAHALGQAFDLIRAGRVHAALAGSSESTLSPFAVDGYCQLRALSTRNDAPTTASRPFSASRDGFVIAEGAGILVLESLEHARARGAEVLAELAGHGSSGDGYHMTAPDPDGRGAIRAMRMALADAGLSPDQVDLVNAHGTSTQLNDANETRAIRAVFGAHADRLWVHATKSMTGHALGASASLEAVACVLTLMHGVVHPTANLHDPDPACDLDFVPLVARERRVRTVMSNSFGFGGHNGVLILKAFED